MMDMFWLSFQIFKIVWESNPCIP